MSPACRHFPDEFYRDADLRLVQAIPSTALDLLDTESESDALAEVLRHLIPERRVYGLGNASVGAFSACFADAEDAARRLPAGSLDLILAGPRSLATPAHLAALHQLLRPHGRLLAALPNAQHWTQFDRLLRGEPAAGLTAPQGVRALLDAGFLPRIEDRRVHALPDAWLAALPALAERQRLGLETCLARSQTLTYIVGARPLPEPPAGVVAPVTVGVCCNDAEVLADNLLASPDLQDGPHQVLTIEGASSLAAGFDAVLAQAQHDLVVFVHQDVYLPRGWFARLRQQYVAAQRITGERVGVLGVYGVRGTPDGLVRAGRVADRDALLDETTPLPEIVSSLDEIVLAVPRDTPLRPDPALGFHLYGSDLALAAERAGLVALAIDAPCHHNSQQGRELPAAFHASAAVLRARWPERLPLATPCMLLR